MATTAHTVSIDPATQIGFTSLTVSDMERSLAFYVELLGFAVLDAGGSGVVLGADDGPLLILMEDRGAAPWTRGYTGLHHVAVLLPARSDLGRLYRRLLEHGHSPIGEDHRVSEAIYFDDPDNMRMEVYSDRPKGEQGVMGAGSFDAEGLLAEAGDERSAWRELPEGTRIGHMHLRVADIERAKQFYHGVLGFDVMAEMPEALFLSAGGYHHHLGMNVWESKGASAPPPHMAGLRLFTVDLPDGDALTSVVHRVETAELPVEWTAEGASVQDPWGTRMLLRQRPE